MVDATSSHTGGSLISGDDSAIKRRRRAETRLKAYGIIAIGLSALALVALLSSVVTKAVSALTETYVVTEIALPAEDIDPDGTGDTKTILRADYTKLVRDHFREMFPNAKGRTVRRELSDVVSGGAAFELGEMVSQNTDLVGGSTEFALLASDVTDLYLKGAYGRIRPVEAQGALTVSGEDDVTISTSDDDFADALTEVKSALIVKAAAVRRQSALQNNGVREFERRLESAETDEAKAEAEAQILTRTAARDDLIAEAEALEARASGQGGAEDLGRDTRSLLINANGGWVKLTRLDVSSAEGEIIIPFDSPVESATDWTLYISDLPEVARKVSDNQIIWIETLQQQGAIQTVFNSRFFTSGDSREPELAGIWGAVVGSALTMLVTFCLAFPIGVLSAIYLEEFAPKNKFTDFIEININNLAAVPSIVFGLLGLAVFLGVFGVPRSAPLAGGIVLALMTLPTIIIASRAAIRAVPPSIREAALGVGASRLQTAFDHVLPLAMPGILTGTIIGMAQALGETAPLIMIGMVAFIVDIPNSITDSATVLPVQVFRWSDFPERAFEARTAAAICVLLVFLVVMNAIAIVLRRRFERRW